MNKTKFLLIALAIVTMCAGFSSCSKDDDNENVSIVGKWKMTYMGEIDKSENEIIQHGIPKDGGVILYADGTVEQYGQGEDDEEIKTLASAAEPQKGTYTLEGTKLTVISQSGYKEESIVVKLTETDLWLEYNDTYNTHPDYKYSITKFVRVK